ncbi:hypothetical protein CRE_00592 [Caenorhabditis remanei]|uniref:Uncharacterized protein n=1 Tax=Caenorhabditis remanei TaxID=31234 RepID=E3LDB6_CAERE|nr:hypothetical protein CRE_00592 [Caenorhabditis remanei]
MVPLVCRYNDNEKAKPRHIWFLVDSGSPYTCLSAKAFEYLVGERTVRGLYSCAIQDPSTNIECRLSKGNFSEVNLLGMNAVRRLKLSIDIDWYSETFQLIQK